MSNNVNDILKDEPYNPEFWWMLQEIRKEFLATPSDEYVIFILRKEPTAPLPARQSTLLRKLKELKVLKSIDSYSGPLPGSTLISHFNRTVDQFVGKAEIDAYQIDVDNVVLENVYKSYESKIPNYDKLPRFDVISGDLFFAISKKPISFNSARDPFKVIKALWDKKPEPVNAEECGVNKVAFATAISRIRERLRASGCHNIQIQSAGKNKYRLAIVDKVSLPSTGKGF
jgi:hypothetical protein